MSSKNQRGFTLIEVIILPLVILGIIGIIGWIMNIIAIASSDFGLITGLMVLRIIGVLIAPLGAVLGLFF